MTNFSASSNYRIRQTVATSGVNDLILDEQNGKIYIADPAAGAEAALIVVDTESGAARRVLHGHRSTVAEDADLEVDGRATVRHVEGENSPHRTGADSIALDSDAEWLYYGPLHGTTMFRIPTTALNGASLPPEELATAVEDYSTVIRPDCSSEIFVQDERLNWPDSLSYGPDGNFYVVTNQLTAALNAGQAEARPPFHVLRFAPLSEGRVGH